MKRFLGLLILLLTFTVRPAWAQSFDAQKAYDDYVFNFTQYRQALTEYQQAREAHLNYQTESSRQAAVNKTQSLLAKRDAVVWTYLTAIRQKLAETTSINNYTLNVLYLKLDDEIYWFQQQSQAYQTATELDQLLALNQAAQKRYGEVSEAFAYQGLSYILLGEEEQLENEAKEIAQALTAFSETPPILSESKLAVVFSSLENANAKLEQSRIERLAGQSQVTAFSKNQRQRTTLLNGVREAAQTSQQTLRQAIIFLKQTLDEITHL